VRSIPQSAGPISPTLDDLAAQPERAATLTPDERTALLAKALVVVVALASSHNGAPAPATPSAERALRLSDAAARLSMTRDSLYRKWRRLPELGGYLDADNRVKFPASKVEQYIRMHR
jgi:hypothetical protein